MNTHSDSMLILDLPSSTSVMQCGILTAATKVLIAVLAVEKAVVRSVVRMTKEAAHMCMQCLHAMIEQQHLLQQVRFLHGGL